MPYVFLGFALIMYFVLIRASIIDIKTLFVPDNIVYGVYSVAILSLVLQIIFYSDLNILKNGFIGFVVGFGVPYLISLISYFINKKTGNNNEVSEALALSNGQGKKEKIKQTLFYILLTTTIIYIGINQVLLSPILFISISLLIVVVLTSFTCKSKDIYVIFYGFSIYCIGMIILSWNKELTITLFVILTVIISLCLELLIGRGLNKFNNIDQLIKEEQKDLSEGKEITEGGIGGGDILILGALGIQFGYKGLIIIFFYSCIMHLVMILFYYFFSDKLRKMLPFVPSIALGTLAYISGHDFLFIRGLVNFILNIWGGML